MIASTSPQIPKFSAVYGPVQSWRFGRSLGIDPIGLVSTCSFNCCYCQLGRIQQNTTDRKIYVSTSQIIHELTKINSGQYLGIDVVTISGSGEPTLALNLAEILTAIKNITEIPVVVLTNSSKLDDPDVRKALTLADIVAVKFDAVSTNQLRQINQPTSEINLANILAGIKDFRQEYQGYMAIQTMVLSNWTPEVLSKYIQLVENLQPDEIQLNVPSRPRVLSRQLESRGNDRPEIRTYGCQTFKCINTQELNILAAKINNATSIPIRYNPLASLY
jgi:wyosine [tRNA(Phe)-imidazoG37] synthetase (radical SAM superfamily)